MEKPSLALDSNFLFDLAAGENFALDFHEIAIESGCRLFVPPTVVQELAFCESRDELALRALQRIREWGIEPFDLVGVGRGIAEGFSKLLRKRRLLPEKERNDGEILAEVALRGLRYLITSDSHLLNMDLEALRTAFRERDLDYVEPVSPRRFLRVLR